MSHILDSAVETAANALVKSYVDYNNKYCKDPEYAKGAIKRYADSVKIQKGKKFYKVISDGSVRFFVVAEPTAGFEVGDILKPASAAAPAKNFARGNVFNDLSRIYWTGAH
jgi:hypothetical protein